MITFGPHWLQAQSNLTELGALPEAVFESSGLIFLNGKAITHNDSGNLPQLFEIDTVSLDITRTVTVSNADNVDWEDIAQDDTYIYVADIGNNLGTRLYLTVYRILKSDFEQSDTITAERIEYSYEDQTDFSDSGNSDWDAEAIFVHDQQLVILTKQWKTNGTVAYAVPKLPGIYSATRLDGFSSEGLVTGATYNPVTKVLYILGYTSVLEPFVFRASGLTPNSIFGGMVTKTNLDLGFAQAEGITYTDGNRYLISTEEFTLESPMIQLPSLLFGFTVDDTPDENETPDPEPNPGVDSLILFGNKGAGLLEYRMSMDKPVLGQAVFDVSGKRIRFNTGTAVTPEYIDISSLRTAIYYLSLYLPNEVLTKSFAKY
ncbi:MAG: T9SS type A sorting domain-containing protein [Flavobacteriaceae bacterium]